jgi:hypothetical protein
MTQFVSTCEKATMLSRIGGIAGVRAATATAVLIAFQGVGTGKDETIREKLHHVYLNEASGYKIYRDSGRTEKLILNPEPVYVWTNPIRGGEQDGEVFVWSCRGRAEVVATFFSFPKTGPRSLHHEMHALGTTTLDVSRAGAHGWHPTAPGMDFRPIPDAPSPGKTPVQRMIQMRNLSRDFFATTVSDTSRSWDLRLLPRPLFRNESTDPDVVDGAVFGFVTSAGTDPEAILYIEARKARGTATPSWHFGLGRFTDMQLIIKLKDKEVLNLPLIPFDVPDTDTTQRYRTFKDRQIAPVEGYDEAGKKTGVKP